MAGYFGTPQQRKLQAAAESGADLVAATPGACQTGRMSGCDDPERYGWDRIFANLERDRVFGFRLLPARHGEDIRTRLASRGYRFDTWDVFANDAEGIADACDGIVASGVPGSLSEHDLDGGASDAEIEAVQATMAAAGVTPFSGSFLTGALGPATTIALADAEGGVVSTAHAYLPHNARSPYRCWAWVGLIAVAEAARGKGVGRYITARVSLEAIRTLGADQVYGLVSASNTASRRMVEACGLVHTPELICGLATPVEAARFTA